MGINYVLWFDALSINGTRVEDVAAGRLRENAMRDPVIECRRDGGF
jgi:hypothetical protein